MTQYFLRTERLGFRAWTAEDAELAMGLWGDAEVTKLIGGPFSRAQVMERLEREIANGKAHGIQYWAVFLLAGGEHIGCCGFRPYKPELKIHEHGFQFLPAHWGHGYATEAARAAIGYAFKDLGAAGLFAGHHPSNDASRALLGKLGFRCTGEGFYPPTGLIHPVYMLRAEEWRGKP